MVGRAGFARPTFFCDGLLVTAVTPMTELAIIGAGNMAEAIVRGVLRAGLLKPEQMIAADVAVARRELFSRELDVQAVESNADAVRGARRVLLSVKPQMMQAALE